jgi:leader peptidase (prepilin peptidase)/N-methyltransferase
VQPVIAVGCGLSGGALGTLLPRLVYRLSVAYAEAPEKTCRHCAAAFPSGLRGWLAFGSQCARCRQRLTCSVWTYVAATAVTVAVLAWRLPSQRPDQVLLLAAWLVFAVAGVLLAAVDIRVNRIPTPVLTVGSLPVCVLVAASAITAGRPARLLDAAGAGIVVGAGYLVLALLRPGQLGMGDVRLAALVSLVLGMEGWNAVLLGALLPYLLAAPVSVVLLLRQRIRRQTQIPFGPYLVAGAVLAAVMAG